MQKEKGAECKFKGTVVRSVYDSDSFRIYGVKVDTKKYPFIKLNKYNNATIKGEIPVLTPDVEYEITANENADKYGISYYVSGIRRDEPMTREGIYAFLCEILTPNQATALFDAYPNILDLVKNRQINTIDVSKLYGIGEKTLAKIIDKITENFYLYDLVSEFNGIVTMPMLKKIYKKYPSVPMLKQKLQRVPYSTLTKVSGIGYKKADAIILTLQEEGVIDFGYDIKTSVDRCSACIVYLLTENENDGHTKMNLAELRKRVFEMVPACADKFAEAIQDDAIYYNKDDFEIARSKTHDAEMNIATTIFNNIVNDNVWECDTEKYRSVGEFELSDEQLSVLSNVCKYNISILNGPAGSGKSASTQALINMLEESNKTYELLAPTGKSSKVLADFTGRHASTIHRGLGYDGVQWTYGERLKLTADIVIVDEVSMVDVNVFNHLVDAIDFNKTKLLMIGDNAQLPSVGCGNILHDFMQSGLIPTVSLSKIFRYGDGGLLKVATDMRMGKEYLDRSMKDSVTPFGTSADYVFMDVPKERSINNAVSVYKKLLDGGCKVEDIQVLTAKNVGEYGTIKLNSMLQKIANKNYDSDERMIYGDSVYYKGDLIIECQNNYNAPLAQEYLSPIERKEYDDVLYETGKPPTAFVANGENGIVRAVTNSFLDIDFGGVVVRYYRDMMNMVTLGYAITVHKSQGASLNNVILITTQSDIFMLNSNLVYVGCTRAKKRCFHIGSVDTMNKVVHKKANLARHTFMQQILQRLKEESELSTIDENGYNQ